jgi:hypothetical protein
MRWLELKDKIIVRKGIWNDSDATKRKMRITIVEGDYNTYDKKKRFAVWFDTDVKQFEVQSGYYASEYEAIDIVEKIIRQKVQWQVAAVQLAQVRV